MGYGKVTDQELDFIKRIVGPERMSLGESVLDLHGGESLKLMKQIKNLLDPNGIMNPGKIFE